MPAVKVSSSNQQKLLSIVLKTSLCLFYLKTQIPLELIQQNYLWLKFWHSSRALFLATELCWKQRNDVYTSHFKRLTKTNELHNMFLSFCGSVWGECLACFSRFLQLGARKVRSFKWTFCENVVLWFFKNVTVSLKNQKSFVEIFQVIISFPSFTNPFTRGRS